MPKRDSPSAQPRPEVGSAAALMVEVQHPHVCSSSTRAAVLRSTRLFCDLDPEEIDRVDALMGARSAPEGAVLCEAGEPADSLFVLAAGRAKSYIPTAEGTEVVEALLAPGDMFGGLVGLGDRRHLTTVRTLTDVCVLWMDAPSVRQLLVQLPSVALRVIDELSEQLDAARGTTALLASSPVITRVAATLNSLCDKFGTPSSTHPGAIDLHLPLSRADLAGLTGSTVESVSRTMSVLRREGVVSSRRRRTMVLDRERLRALGSAQENRPDDLSRA